MNNVENNERLVNAYGLNGQTALVTGGGTGLGKAIATCLAQSGAKVIIAGRRADVLESACAEIGHGCRYLALDLQDMGSIAGFATTILEEFGPIDVLVNNAGNTIKKPFMDPIWMSSTKCLTSTFAAPLCFHAKSFDRC